MAKRADSSTVVLLGPACVLFAAFVVGPVVAGLALSLQHWDGVGPRRWAGLDNYRELVADPVFRIALGNNLRWLALYLLAPLLGLGLALLLNQSMRGMRVIRSLFFAPFVLSQVVVGLVFAWLYNPRLGLFPQALHWMGLPAFSPLDSERGAIYALVSAGLWPQTAYCMILYLTGLATLRQDVIEAARLDGARGWTLFRHVVLPQLRPVNLLVAMVCIVSALRSFDYVAIMSGGGPYDSSTVLAYYMFEQTFVASRYGYGAAIAAVLLALMTGVIVAMLWRLLRAEARVDGRPNTVHAPPLGRAHSLPGRESTS